MGDEIKRAVVKDETLHLVKGEDVRSVKAEHGKERVVRLDELRPGQGTLLQRLRARARLLADLIAASERTLRGLQRSEEHTSELQSP